MKVIKNRKIKKIKSRITLGIMRDFCSYIISYQEITGNYSMCVARTGATQIISYQEIIGNYSSIFGIPLKILSYYLIPN